MLGLQSGRCVCQKQHDSGVDQNRKGRARFFMFSKPEAADISQDQHDCSIDQNREEAPIFVLSKLEPEDV
jgi:hypothetical protein